MICQSLSFRNGILSAIVCFALSKATVAAVWADTACPETEIRIIHDVRLNVSDICHSADRAQSVLQEYGLALGAPIAIYVVDEAINEMEDCLAAYHCDQDEITILEPHTIQERVASNQVLGLIPDSELVFSLLLHEFIHASISRSEWAKNVSLLEDEYIAYALQFDALATEVHAKIGGLESTYNEPSIEKLSELLLMMDPTDYGVLSWRHYSQPENGRRFMMQLLQGTANIFEPTLPDHP